MRERSSYEYGKEVGRSRTEEQFSEWFNMAAQLHSAIAKRGAIDEFLKGWSETAKRKYPDEVERIAKVRYFQRVMFTALSKLNTIPEGTTMRGAVGLLRSCKPQTKALNLKGLS